MTVVGHRWHLEGTGAQRVQSTPGEARSLCSHLRDGAELSGIRPLPSPDDF